MGYQETFLIAKSNKDTKKLFKAMQRENIRGKDDILASIQTISKTKLDITTYNNIHLEKGRKMILITGERMRSVEEYLLPEYDAPIPNFTNEEKNIISNTIMIPIECFVEDNNIRIDKIIEDELIYNDKEENEEDEFEF